MPLVPLANQESFPIADNQPAIHVVPRHRVPSAVGQRFRPIPHQLPAVENFFQERMGLPNLNAVCDRMRIGILQIEQVRPTRGRSIKP